MDKWIEIQAWILDVVNLLFIGYFIKISSGWKIVQVPAPLFSNIKPRFLGVVNIFEATYITESTLKTPMFYKCWVWA